MVGKQLLDDFFDKLNGKTPKYSELRKVLLEINQRIKNSNSVIFDHKNQSFLANFRSMIGNSFNNPHTDDSEYLGILLTFRDVNGNKDRIDAQPIRTRYYVDVPLNDNEYKKQAPSAINGQFLNSVSQKIFYPIDERAADAPQAGSVVRVKLSENFLNNISNPFDNKYLGYYKQCAVEPDEVTFSKKTPEEIKASARTDLYIIETDDDEKGSYKRAPGDSFGQPLAGTNVITSGIVHDRNIGTARHYALDLKAGIGTEVFSVSEGTVVSLGKESVIIKYDRPEGYKPYYFGYYHLSRIDVKMGEKISKNQKIGLTGTGGTGPHLHFEVAKDASRKEESRLQPGFILEGPYDVSDSVQSTYGYPQTLNFPIATTTEELAESVTGKVAVPTTVVVPTKEEAAATPIATDPGDASNPTPEDGTAQSIPKSVGKLKLTIIETDYPKGVKKNSRLGSTRLKVREDIANDILKIKDVLNAFQIPLSVLPSDVRLESKELSLLGRLGLEVVLNRWMGLSDDSNINTDDYLIGPDYNKKLAVGYGLKIYGRCGQIVNVPTGKYQPIYEPIEVYSVRNTVNAKQPDIVKINIPVLDITQIFEDYGFRQALPKATFFKYSKLEDANWNIFQKPSKIIKGYTYREALETVYYVDNNSIWNNKPLVWNGDRFI